MEADIDNRRRQQMENNIDNWYHTLFDDNDSIKDPDVAAAWQELVDLIRANHICHFGVLITNDWLAKSTLTKINDLLKCLNYSIEIFVRRSSIPLVP